MMKKSLLLFFSLNLLTQLSFGQETLDSLAFQFQLSVIDSLNAYQTSNDCIDHIDSISSTSPLTEKQKSQLNIIKANRLADSGKDSLALILITKEKSYLQSNADTTSLSYSNLLQASGTVRMNKGEYEKAMEKYLQRAEICKTTIGDMNSEYGTILSRIAYVHQKLRNYKLAEENFIEASEIQKKTIGENHPNYAKTLDLMASLYHTIGQLDKSVELFIQAKDIRKEVLGEEHGDYASSINNVAVLYYYLGEYKNAEPYFLKSINITKSIEGEKSQSYSNGLNNMASLYSTMGLYEKAEAFYLQSLEIYREIYDEDNSETAAVLNNLGQLYYQMKQYNKAEKYNLEVKRIRENTVGKDHPDYAEILNNLASSYKKLGNFEKAEQLSLEALDIYQKEFGEESLEAGISLNNLGTLYDIQGKYKQAEPLLIKNTEIRKKILGDGHREVAICLNNLAWLYERMEQYEEASKYFIEANNISKKLLMAAFEFLSEKEKLHYHNRVVKTIDYLKYLGLEYKSNDISREIYDNLLFEKGIHLKSNIQTKVFFEGQGNVSTKQTYEDFLVAKEELYKQYLKPKSKQEGVKELENKIEQLEKKMARASASFRNEREVHSIDATKIIAKLKKDEVAIEFTNFKRGLDTIVYAANILSSNGDNEFVFLTTAEILQNKLKKMKGTNSSFINEVYGMQKRGIVVDKNVLPSLHELIWQPLKPYIKGATKIYYSPSGLLNRLNVNAIAIDEEQVLADKFNLIELMSTRTVALDPQVNSSKEVYIIGGVDYESNDWVNAEATLSKNEEFITSENVGGSSRGSTWQYLKWTETESESIEELFKDSGFEVSYKSTSEASELDFKTLGKNNPSPRILHLATHGFFFPDLDEEGKNQGKNIFERAEDPMFRSGLILAGGNYVWDGNDILEGKEDGVLTAYEISNMNLSNTELVVLSACETGLGDIHGSEGVYGLQRSFKMAGVKYLIMSLWQVPDRATSVFMTRFYENLLKEKMTIRDAFNVTQLEMRDRFFDPYNWAGFVLIE